MKIISTIIIIIFLSILSNRNNAASNSKFEKIFIITFSNRTYSEVKDDPYFAELSSRGVDFTFYMGISYPSQPNRWGHTAGAGYYYDDNKHNLRFPNIINSFESKGITWKVYAQNWPGNCFDGMVSDDLLYWRRHNPFISFDNVRLNETLCSNIVDASRLDHDIIEGMLPQYSYFIPNFINDGDETVESASAWLKGFLEPKLDDKAFSDGNLIVITFDTNLMEFNHIYAVLLGPLVKEGTQDDILYNHYSLLRSIEDNWGLKPLTENDRRANNFLSNLK